MVRIEELQSRVRVAGGAELLERLEWLDAERVRPPVESPSETPFPEVVLAGDFVRLPIPTALMERAATSGFMAANHLLAGWEVRGQELWSVPRRGLLAGLPLLAS